MTNRYTNLSYSNLNDLPLLSLPFEQLQGVLSASQQAKDQFDELSGLTPKYIQNSASDVKLAGTVKQYQNDVAAQLAEIAQSGDANKYRRELANARKNIVKMWQPGGAANALETRYAEDLKDQAETKVEEVKDQLLIQLNKLPRKEIAEKALENSKIIVVKSLILLL